MSTRLSSEPIEMGDYFSVILRRKALVAGITLAGLAVALVYSMAIANPSYVSVAEVEVRPVSNTFGGVNIDNEINMGTERELVRSAAVAELAAEKVPGKATARELQKKLTVSAVGSTQLLAISCSGATSQGAQECAQGFADAYLEFRTDRVAAKRDAIKSGAEAELNKLNEQINTARTRLGQAPPASGAYAEASAVLDSLEDQANPYREILAEVNTIDPKGAGVVVSTAGRPTAAASPKPMSNAVFGSFFGLFLGLLVAFGRDRVDGRLRGRVDLEEQLRAPVLASVPRTRRSGRAAPTLVTMQHPHSPASEAYRALRTRMLVIAEREGMKTIMVASPTGEDGKTAIAANLAVALSQVGKRVVLMSADLRKSNVHQYFGLDNERGLSNVLSGEMPPWEAVQEPPGLERLWVFGSGPTPAHPAELLQSDLMRELLAERRKVADFVIIEAPAILESSDSLALAPLVDGILVVADARTTGRDQVGAVREQYEGVGGQVVGAVLSNVSSRN